RPKVFCRGTRAAKSARSTGRRAPASASSSRSVNCARSEFRVEFGTAENKKWWLYSWSIDGRESVGKMPTRQPAGSRRYLQADPTTKKFRSMVGFSFFGPKVGTEY